MWYAIKQFLSLVRQKAFSHFTHFTLEQALIQNLHLCFLSVCAGQCPTQSYLTSSTTLAEFRTFFLFTSSSVGLLLADRPLFLTVIFPAPRRACAISDRKLIRVLHLVIPLCEQWRRYRSHAFTTHMSSKWNTMRK